ESQARVLGAKDGETRAAIVAVTATLEHDLMNRARSAEARGECYREIPLTLRMEDGDLIEGVADLVFRDGKRWNVVDFKTDLELAPELNQYRRQVSIYAAAISAARQVQSAAFLFRI